MALSWAYPWPTWGVAGRMGVSHRYQEKRTLVSVP